MPPQRRIAINKNPQGPSPLAVFNPNPLQAEPRDQIFWANFDSVAHWPDLVSNPIAPGGTSEIFAPSAPATFKYTCSLHPDEEGTIIVT